MGGITLIIADSALELVPVEIAGHPAIRSSAKQTKNRPSKILLNSSHHHTAMRKLSDHRRRGRPDIVHFTLLEALGSLLNRSGLLRTYVHTLHDWVIALAPQTRLPRQSDRFNGLITQLFVNGELPIPKGQMEPLIELRKNTPITTLLDELGPRLGRVIGFSETGRSIRLTELFQTITRESIMEKPITIIIGGFPIGDFSKGTGAAISELYSIYPEPLDAWTVTSRVLGAIEVQLGII